MNALNEATDATMVSTLKAGRVSVIDAPQSTLVSGDFQMTTWIVAAFIGMALGALWCIVKFFITPTLVRLNESGIPVIGGIVNFKQDWRNIVKEKGSDAKHLFKKKKDKKDKKDKKNKMDDPANRKDPEDQNISPD